MRSTVSDRRARFWIGLTCFVAGAVLMWAFTL